MNIVKHFENTKDIRIWRLLQRKFEIYSVSEYRNSKLKHKTEIISLYFIGENTISLEKHQWIYEIQYDKYTMIFK